ncbi:MAG: putative metal-binding motif-containing protein [Myxococcota bacterium]|nr:putative metal-binding motif-containing protein [Myxococcota bacterium]
MCPSCDDHCTPDCDDTDPSIHPDQSEQCDGLDNDCDGWIDEGVACPQGCSCTDTGWTASSAVILVAPLVFTGRRLRRRGNDPHRS